MYTLERRTYLTADGKRAVDEGDPEAATLLGIEGDTLSDEQAKALGLVAGKAVKPAEDKAVKGPQAKKSE